MTTQRSNTSTRVRTQAGSDIYETQSANLSSSETRKQFRERIGWRTYKDKKGAVRERYSVWAVEVLHKDYEGELDIHNVFLNPILFRVFAAIIRGKSAVAAMIANGTPASARRNETVSDLWGCTEITPGAIAMCGVVARWAISADDCLQEKGKQTGIDWRADFETYLKYLLDGLNNDKTSVKNIFREWNAVFFPGQDGRDEHSDDDSETRNALDMLADDEEEGEGEGENENENENEGENEGEGEREDETTLTRHDSGGGSGHED
ncbi:hypothetical protein PLICRDRAFT_178915 [Plicaturopsis crispa FD-325 SS-3]|uniref:Uncharacterized protein n=1 Tax=Plicaturopsis crispa FD-325 SS-3 TaxID=944288 RepID=A0A0C9SYN5_PLICR|nr:hypothetical protein PLICRDRAFT_178915 [Plicaturopsis crispa FD-325 SS-3]